MINHCSKNKIIPYLVFYHIKTNKNKKTDEEEKVEVKEEETEEQKEDNVSPHHKSESKRMDDKMNTITEALPELEETNQVHGNKAERVSENPHVSQEKEPEKVEEDAAIKLEEVKKEKIEEIKKEEIEEEKKDENIIPKETVPATNESLETQEPKEVSPPATDLTASEKIVRLGPVNEKKEKEPAPHLDEVISTLEKPKPAHKGMSKTHKPAMKHESKPKNMHVMKPSQK